MVKLIKKSTLIKEGRIIIGPVFPKIVTPGDSNIPGVRERRVQAEPVSGRAEIRPEQETFNGLLHLQEQVYPHRKTKETSPKDTSPSAMQE